MNNFFHNFSFTKNRVQSNSVNKILNFSNYKNKTENYPEYTMIGKPLTELFRLESVSENNSINYFHISSYDSMELTKDGVFKYSRNSNHSYWRKSELIPVKLKGVDWSFFKIFSCTYKTS